MPDKPVPVTSYRVSDRYTISQKIALIQTYRAVVDKLAACNGQELSPQAISETIEDVFLSFGHWDKIKDPLFISMFKRATLDPHTLRKLLHCDLDINLRKIRKIHARSIRVLHAFLQILASEPPSYLGDCLGEEFPAFPRGLAPALSVAVTEE